MIKRLLILLLFILPTLAFAKQNVTIKDLVGTWQIDELNEKYSFKANGKVLYIVGNTSREYPFKLVGNEIIIQREMGITINRLIENFHGNKMKLIDKDIGIELQLTKEH